MGDEDGCVGLQARHLVARVPAELRPGAGLDLAIEEMDRIRKHDGGGRRVARTFLTIIDRRIAGDTRLRGLGRSRGLGGSGRNGGSRGNRRLGRRSGRSGHAGCRRRSRDGGPSCRIGRAWRGGRGLRGLAARGSRDGENDAQRDEAPPDRRGRHPHRIPPRHRSTHRSLSLSQRVFPLGARDTPCSSSVRARRTWGARLRCGRRTGW